MASKNRQMDLRRKRIAVRRHTCQGERLALRQHRDLPDPDEFHYVAGTGPQLPKLSERVLEFVYPFCSDDTDDGVFLDVVNLAVMAWNYESSGDDAREIIMETIARFVAKHGMPPEYMAMFTGMVAAKHERFPDDRRFIVDFKLTGTGNKRHLMVMSAIDKADLPALAAQA
jgi:hypothetical protein